MAEAKRVYWDACVWISLIEMEADRETRCRELLELAEAGEIQIWTSSITLAEVFKRKCSAESKGIQSDRDRDFEEYLLRDFVVEAQVDHEIGTMARRLLRNNGGLKKPSDAIHLATAVLFDIDEFHTFDGENLLPLNGKVHRNDGQLLTICEPPEPPKDNPARQAQLFGGAVDEQPKENAREREVTEREVRGGGE